MDFKERCRAEMTRDVIFLFQVPMWIYAGYPHAEDGEYRHDGEGTRLGNVVAGHWSPREGSGYLTNAQLVEMETVDGIPCATQYWETKFVVLTREEGEHHGNEYDYRYRDGWRVYGIPSQGKLPEMIRQQED